MINSKNVVVFNLGCKVNQYECDVICDNLKNKGYQISQELGPADVYVINTCAVTAEAEKKSRQAIARCRALNASAKILVVGCASQKNPQSFVKDNVTYISGVAGKFSIDSHLNNEIQDIDIKELPTVYEDGELDSAYRTRSYIKIQDGCNNFCSYCIIPHLRGRSRSRRKEEIVKEIAKLSGFVQEIVLTGIDLMAYGLDIGYDLKTLIEELEVFNLRIRLGSLYAERITSDLLESLKKLKKFCPHFHLSMQSGDDGVLKSMNRHYTANVYKEKIDLIKEFFPDATITTDIIVGFPTETEEAFLNTCEFVKEVNFSDIHIFPYSAREGTRAAKLPQIDKEIVKTRKKILSNIKKDLVKKHLIDNLGKRHEVLVEEKVGEYYVGHTRNYIKVYLKENGEIVTTIPNKIFNDGLMEE